MTSSSERLESLYILIILKRQLLHLLLYLLLLGRRSLRILQQSIELRILLLQQKLLLIYLLDLQSHLLLLHLYLSRS